MCVLVKFLDAIAKLGDFDAFTHSLRFLSEKHLSSPTQQQLEEHRIDDRSLNSIIFHTQRAMAFIVLNCCDGSPESKNKKKVFQLC